MILSKVVSKMVVCAWLATAAFCLLQILFGPTGLTETARVIEQRQRLERRLIALQEENQHLSARYEALRTSQEAVRLEARSLGWFQPGETPVRTLEGTEFRLPPDEPDLSSVPALSPEGQDTTLFFRLAWPLLFIAFYAFFHLLTRMWPSKPSLPVVFHGVRQNLPVPLQTGLDFFRK
jgi:cell division protein FtsB